MRIGLIAAACIMLVACGQQHPAATTPPSTTTAIAATHRALEVGACVDTKVSNVGTRLEGMANSGSAILYANGLSQVSYDAVAGIDHAKAGDRVHLCLVSVPQNCPPGDDRGKIYAATNQRTRETWQAPDSEHACGGA